MARLARVEVFSPDEVAIVHVMNRVVRRCFLFGIDPVSRKNFDHRKIWIEDQLRVQAACFGIDVLGFAILSNHFHLILRSRPDCVEKWDDTEVARRWLMLCPVRKDQQGHAAKPNDVELNSIRNDKDRVQTIRSRLSDVLWWMRLLCQQIAVRANKEDKEVGRFFQSRYRAVRLLDEQALVACAAYVDLNPIRATMSETLEASDFTSVQRRIQSVQAADSPATAVSIPSEESVATKAVAASTRSGESNPVNPVDVSPVAANSVMANSVMANSVMANSVMANADQFLAPVELNQRTGKTGAVLNQEGTRCSDKGFLAMSLDDYVKLLDWTGRQIVRGKKGRIPKSVEPILQRLKLDRHSWCEFVSKFGKRFFHVAGEPTTIEPTTIDATTSRRHDQSPESTPVLHPQ